MPINPLNTVRVQSYIPKKLFRRMQAVQAVAPYYTISRQIQLAIDSRMTVMEDRVKGGA